MLSCLFSCRKRALREKVLLRGAVDFIIHLTQGRLVAEKKKKKQKQNNNDNKKKKTTKKTRFYTDFQKDLSLYFISWINRDVVKDV